jgi:hypothetical protein
MGGVGVFDGAVGSDGRTGSNLRVVNKSQPGRTAVTTARSRAHVRSAERRRYVSPTDISWIMTIIHETGRVTGGRNGRAFVIVKTELYGSCRHITCPFTPPDRLVLIVR